ncbi:MAG: ABC transporter permease [Bryobacteraceae bacterium]
MFELFIAGRYLRAKRKQVMISVISVISVIGVATGVMALVIALAVTNGLRNTTQRTFLAATAHVMIMEKTRGPGIDSWEAIAQKLATLPGVQSVSPALYDATQVNGNSNSLGVAVKGVSFAKGGYLPDILVHLKEGSLDDMREEKDGTPGILLGVETAKQVGAIVGSTVRLLIVHVTPYGPRPSLEPVRVAGVFESGMYNYDNGLVFMSLEGVQKLWGYPDIVNSIEMNLNDIYQAPAVAKAAEAVIGKDLAATTWQEQNKPILDAFQLERTVSVITIGLIQLVAALNILTTLVMMVMEKKRDIAILMAMGAKTGQIRRIFIYKGAIIGAIGIAIGLVLGYGISYFAEKYQWLKLDAAVYSMKYLPLEANWSDAIWIAAAAMTVSLLATIYPARSATKITPVESMRYE